MRPCYYCNTKNFKVIAEYKYHDIIECLKCGRSNIRRIENCCRFPFEIVTIDRKDHDKYLLYLQCISCGGADKTKALNTKKHSEFIRSEFCDSRYEQWRLDRSNEFGELSTSVKNYNYSNSQYFKYLTYLQSVEWKSIRSRILERDNYICQNCKKNHADDIHHLSYDHLFCEKDEELISLCRNCHLEEHGKLLPVSDFENKLKNSRIVLQNLEVKVGQ